MEDLIWAEQGRYWDTSVGCMFCEENVQAYVVRADGKTAMYGYRCPECKDVGPWFRLARYYLNPWGQG